MPVHPILLVGAVRADDAATPNLQTVADASCTFVAATRSTLHIAAYHFKFSGAVAQQVRDALATVAARAGVKIACFDEPRRAWPGHRQQYRGDQSGASVFDGCASTRVQLKAIQSIDVHHLPDGPEPAPIEGDGALMHSRCMVRDGTDVWMGTANFTDDGWGLQDNNVLVFEQAPQLAACYSTDFDELWHCGRIAGTGRDDHGSFSQDGFALEVDFSPGDGRAIDARIAARIDAAGASVHVASMDISSTLVLQALQAAIGRGVTVSGVYDAPQMSGVERAWQRAQASADKLACWQAVKVNLTGKASRPFNPGDGNGLCNFMHNKTLVVDRKVLHTGSFNFSGNAARNAENVVELEDATLAGRFADYIDSLVARYR